MLAGGTFLVPDSPRYAEIFFSPCRPSVVTSWLIDNDKDQEGLQVLADMHGGDLKTRTIQLHKQNSKKSEPKLF